MNALQTYAPGEKHVIAQTLLDELSKAFEVGNGPKFFELTASALMFLLSETVKGQQ